MTVAPHRAAAHRHHRAHGPGKTAPTQHRKGAGLHPAEAKPAAAAKAVGWQPKSTQRPAGVVITSEKTKVRGLADQLGIKDHDRPTFLKHLKAANPSIKLDSLDSTIPAGTALNIPANYDRYLVQIERSAKHVSGAHLAPSGAGGEGRVAAGVNHGPSLDIARRGQSSYTHVGASRPTSFAGNVATSAQVQSWIAQALQQLGIDPNSPQGQQMKQALELMIQKESGGNPNAINLWDSNAKAGHPSIGLMQTIQPTFDKYAMPGHTDIRNPVDNIIAGTRYALARYGSLDNVPGVKGVRSGKGYQGY